jgi:DNA-binding NarL/FixJ family response regulator
VASPAWLSFWVTAVCSESGFSGCSALTGSPVRSALAAGAHGFLNKSAEPQEVVRAVRSVAQGRAFVSVPHTQVGLVDMMASPQPEPAEPPSTAAQ